jgi:hypothetical protein
VEAFRGSQGIYKGLVEGQLATASRVADPANIMGAKRVEAKNEVTEAKKAALLISGTNKVRYGQLRNSWQTTTSWAQTITQTCLRRQQESWGTTKAQDHLSLESKRAKGGDSCSFRKEPAADEVVVQDKLCSTRQWSLRGRHRRHRWRRE